MCEGEVSQVQVCEQEVSQVQVCEGEVSQVQVCEGEVSQLPPSCCCHTLQPALLPVVLTVHCAKQLCIFFFFHF